jgi:hypothetical protein
VDIYEFVGKDDPKDIRKMTYMGSPSRGKFTNHFTVDQLGETVWYMIVYVPKKAGATPELTGSVRVTIV